MRAVHKKRESGTRLEKVGRGEKTYIIKIKMNHIVILLTTQRHNFAGLAIEK